MHWNIIYGDRYRAIVYPPLRPRQPPLATWASTDDPLGDNVRRCVCSEMWLAVWVLAVSCDWLCGCGQWAVIGCLGVGSELWLAVSVWAVSCDWLSWCWQWAVIGCVGVGNELWSAATVLWCNGVGSSAFHWRGRWSAAAGGCYRLC